MDQIVIIVGLIWSVLSGAGRLGTAEMLAYKDPGELMQKPGWGRVRIMTTGDVMLGRAVNAAMEKKQDFRYVFEPIQPFFVNSDITLINLESPLVDGCRPTLEGMVFCSNPKSIVGLEYLGVKVVSVANNHIRNYGLEGEENTVKTLNQSGILAVGNGRSEVATVKGVKFGFLGYNDVPVTVEPAVLNREIVELKKQADVVVVSFHWGIEYVADPVTRQKELGQMAVEAGADLVIGNHPHWVEAIEKYQGKLIVYSHGNFVFDQSWSRETQEGVVGKFEFIGNKLVEAGFYPVVINKDYQPVMANQAESEIVLKRMREASARLVK